MYVHTEKARAILKTRRRGVRTLLLTVTDGFAHDFVGPVVEKIRALGSDIELYAVGLNTPVNESVVGKVGVVCCLSDGSVADCQAICSLAYAE